jgi:hypothetical protein
VQLVELRSAIRAKVGFDGFIVDSSYEDRLSKYLLIAGCPKLHALLDKTSIKKPYRLIKYAAQSGDRETCEYARDLYGKRYPLHIDEMLNGAAKSLRGLAICKLAHKWFGEGWTTMNLHPYFERESHTIRTLLNDAAIRAAEHDNVEVCKFLIEWGADNFRSMLWWACATESFRVTNLVCCEMITRDIAIERPSCGPVCAAVLDKYCARV